MKLVIMSSNCGDVIMTSQVSGKVVGIRLEQDECSEGEYDNHSPHEPGVHGDAKHGGLHVCVCEEDR